MEFRLHVAKMGKYFLTADSVNGFIIFQELLFFLFHGIVTWLEGREPEEPLLAA